MNKTLLILTAVSVLGACSTNSTDETDGLSSQIPPSAIVQDYLSVEGLQRATVKMGETTTMEGDFLDGLHHGSWTVYNSDGKVTSITTYLRGKKQGVELLFDNTGYDLVVLNE